MTILAIESSSLVASVAITEDDVMIAEYTIDYKKTHSQTLLPMIDEMCRMTDFQLEKIDAIAVSAGPGSFTGLRIGSATAKGLGLALKKPLIHVPTVEAMAYNFYDTEKYIVPIMDARRNQVYTGIYTSHEGNVEEGVGQCILPMDELIEKIKQSEKEVIFLGDGVPVFAGKIKEELGEKAFFAPAQMNRQKAGSVAQAGKRYFEEGKYFPVAQGVTIDVPEVSVFALKNKYGYDYAIRRKYEGIPFAYGDYGQRNLYDGYQVSPDVKHAYVVNDQTVSAYVGQSESDSLKKIGKEQDSIIDCKKAVSILQKSMATELKINVKRVAFVYCNCAFGEEQNETSDYYAFPCWEFQGENSNNQEYLHLYVDALTGAVYMYGNQIEQ